MELRHTSCLIEESVSAGFQSIWCENPNCWSLEKNSSGKLWNFISHSHRSWHWDVSHAYSLKHISTLAWQISMLITCCNFQILYFRIIQSLLPFLCWPVLSQAISKGCSVTVLLYKLWLLVISSFIYSATAGCWTQVFNPITSPDLVLRLTGIRQLFCYLHSEVNWLHSVMTVEE